MAKELPLWRRAFDAVELPLRVRAESAASTAEFAQALMMLLQASTTLGKMARSTSSTLWHVANLPSYSDLRRVFRQVGALENRLDRMNLEIERLARKLDEHPTPQRPARRRQSRVVATAEQAENP